MNFFVSTAAVAAGAAIPTSAQSDDESFAAVEAHRQAWAHLGVICDELAELEGDDLVETIPVGSLTKREVRPLMKPFRRPSAS